MLLQQPHVYPKVSVYAQVYVPHDYNVAPFLPIGMVMLAHDNLKRRSIFAEHCSKGYVLGTDFLHYRAWTIWMKDTRATRISATTFHKHKYITNPSVTPEDRVMATAVKLAADLKGHMATHLSETDLQKLEKLGTIIK